MYARVWRMSVLPENVERFASACRSVEVVINRKDGYRGLMVLRGGRLDSPEVTAVSLWDSLEALRASEGDTFQNAVARALACCEPGAVMREEEILSWDLVAPKSKSPDKAKKKRGRIKRRAS